MVVTEDVPLVVRGAVKELWRYLRNLTDHCQRTGERHSLQILLEGPAGTGKTRGLLEIVNWMCESFPGMRCLFLRQTKGALAESVLDTWENHVLWEGHECVTGTAQRDNRQHYTYKNGSHIVLGGLNDKKQATKTFSTQYDCVIIFEAREASLNNFQWLARANRNWKMPIQLRIADTNPADEFNWLNQYFPTGYRKVPKSLVATPPKTLRLLSRHWDNPTLWNSSAQDWTAEGRSYIEDTLEPLTGAQRENLYLGNWCSEEGVIYEDFAASPSRYMLEPDELPELKWFFGSFDQGFRHPGCLQIWGVNDDRMYRVREYYQTGRYSEWWADRVSECQEDFPGGLQALVCDPAEPEYIDIFNKRLGTNRDGARIARRAINPIKTGIDMVRVGFSPMNNGPRIFLMRGALVHEDPERKKKLKPTCLEEELRSYVWKEADDGQATKEMPDPRCADHACDALRYASMFLYGRDLTPAPEAHTFGPDTFGHALDHHSVLESMADGGLLLEDLGRRQQIRSSTNGEAAATNRPIGTWPTQGPRV